MFFSYTDANIMKLDYWAHKMSIRTSLKQIIDKKLWLSV